MLPGRVEGLSFSVLDATKRLYLRAFPRVMTRFEIKTQSDDMLPGLPKRHGKHWKIWSKGPSREERVKNRNGPSREEGVKTVKVRPVKNG